MDKYQWTCTGMSVQPVENGPLRYVREVDYDQLQAKVEELTALKAELNTVIYQNAEAENTIIKLRAEINKLKTSDKVFMETYDELMKVQAANHALHALENDKILELKRINADLSASSTKGAKGAKIK